jgi:hypothetical protein
MQEMDLVPLPFRTEEGIPEEQARSELQRQLNECNQLVAEAKDMLVQAEKKEADTKLLHAQADLKVSEAESKFKEVAREADFEARLEMEPLEHPAKEGQCETRIQELETLFEALASANCGSPRQIATLDLLMEILLAWSSSEVMALDVVQFQTFVMPSIRTTSSTVLENDHFIALERTDSI